MQTVLETTLPTLPVEQPAFHADPMPYLEAARRQHPWLARFGQGYIVHGYRAFHDLLAMDDKLKPGLGGIIEFYQAQGTSWARFMDEMLINQTGATHTRLRAGVARAFTPRRANEARPLMRQVIADLLDGWAPRGEFDFADFASYFPVAVICGVLGISTAAIPRVRDAIEAHMGAIALDPAQRPAIMAGFDVLWNFANDAVAERELASFDDRFLLDALIEQRRAGSLDDTELRFMLLVLVIAGYDTSKNMLAVTVHQLLARPAMWRRCAEDKEFCVKVVEEALRHSSIATFYRMVAEDFAYDGVSFRRGDLMVFATPLTGRDPTVFDDPMTFGPERVSATRHLAFGRGAHMCIGQFLAKTQLVEGLHLIAQRLAEPRLAGAVAWRPLLGAWGPRTLPIAFTAAPARTA